MSVFAKTPKGLDALKDLKSGMPRRMRTLLWCINGQTTTSTLMRSLTTVGDVKELMRELIAEGLIGRVRNNAQKPAPEEVAVNAPTATKVDTRWASSGWNMGFPNQGMTTVH